MAQRSRRKNAKKQQKPIGDRVIEGTGRFLAWSAQKTGSLAWLATQKTAAGGWWLTKKAAKGTYWAGTKVYEGGHYFFTEHESVPKRELDSMIDPFMATAAITGAAPVVVDTAAEIIMNHSASGAPLFGLYAGAFMGVAPFFNHVLKPTWNNVHAYHDTLIKKDVGARGASYVRTAASAALLGWMFSNPTINASQNIMHDFDSMASRRGEVTMFAEAQPDSLETAVQAPAEMDSSQLARAEKDTVLRIPLIEAEPAEERAAPIPSEQEEIILPQTDPVQSDRTWVMAADTTIQDSLSIPIQRLSETAREAQPEPEGEPEPVEVTRPRYVAGSLLGQNITSPHHKLFTGLEGIVTDAINVDPAQLLDRMWQRKDNTMRGKRGAISPVAKGFWETVVKQYDWESDRRMTMEAYINLVSSNTDETRNAIRWTPQGDSPARTIKGIYKLTDEEVALTHLMVHSLTPEQQVAYSMSELMDTYDGEKNLAVYEFVIRNFGLEFLRLIPAMGDRYASMGPYQFTSLAVYDAAGTREGASVANLALPDDMKIPGSVIYLTPEDHIDATVLFETHNFALFVKSLNRRQRDVLREHLEDSDDDIAQLLAALHHAPKYGRSSGRDWLNHIDDPFFEHAHNRVKDEAEKALRNYESLMNR